MDGLQNKLVKCFDGYLFILILNVFFLCRLHRYIHIIMVFWSFLAGVVTLYCSIGPESLLPNIFVSIKPKTKVPLLFFPLCQTTVYFSKINVHLCFIESKERTG